MKKHLLLGVGLACALASQAFARQNHVFFTGSFNSGPDVTRACIQCHKKETETFMKTVHWTWSKKQTRNGKTVEHGKKNALSNFYSALPSNWEGCTSCHAGYGWTDPSFDFTNPQNVDCLVCHETTGTYKKSAGGYPLGYGEVKEETKEAPSVETKEIAKEDKTADKKEDKKADKKEDKKEDSKADKKEEKKGDLNAAPRVNLLAVARSVERPNRAACGFCHFYGCGEDGMKHGDLDSSLANPSPEIDIHMGGKAKLTCESCHKAANHDVRGEAISVSFSSAPRAFGCGDCHSGEIHKSAALNMHIKRVACQTCHIPTFAKTVPTVTWWNWTSAGKEKPKGDQRRETNLQPTLFWYNGAVDRVVMGDKIDPGKVVQLTAPKGERKDPTARIFPFKVMKGKQPYDAVNMTVAVVNMTGPADSKTAFSTNYDWNKAIAAGMSAAGQPYSGKYGWIETSTTWSLNHMVAPKEKALTCPNCHVPNGIGRIDWKALGYPDGDPR